MRTAFANTLTDIALADPLVTLLVGDFSFGSFDRLKSERPKQYINCGVSEQATVGIAAGMAIEGLIPVIYTITPFLLERAFEQIKLDVDQQNLHVVLAGFDDYPKDGPTHSPLSVPALCSLLKNTILWEPVSAIAASDALHTAYHANCPSFIHLKNAPKHCPTTYPAHGLDA